MTIGTVSAVPVLAPNLLHVVEKSNRQKEKERGTVDLTSVGAVDAIPDLAPNLLHVVEKRNRQRERIKDRYRPDGNWRFTPHSLSSHPTSSTW
jgi:hypothetical protein